jgi:hypothetical protein
MTSGPGEPTDMTGTEFARLEFAWLAQVASDVTLPVTAVRAAIVLVGYFDRKTQSAYPAIETLARKLQVAERSVQRAIAALAPRHLAVSVGGGRSKQNVYRWRIETAADVEKPRQACQGLADETPTEPSPFEANKPRQARQGLQAERVTALSVKGDRPVAKTPTELSPNSLEENLIKEPLRLDRSLRSLAINDPEAYRKLALAQRPRLPANATSQSPIGTDDPNVSGDVAVRGPSKRAAPKATDAEFDQFYQAYPRHVARGAARKAFDRIIAGGKATVPDLVAGAKRYAAEKTGQDEQYTKHPATWLNAEGWSDEPQPSRPVVSAPNDRRSQGGSDYLARRYREFNEEAGFQNGQLPHDAGNTFTGPTLELSAEVFPRSGRALPGLYRDDGVREASGQRLERAERI